MEVAGGGRGASEFFVLWSDFNLVPERTSGMKNENEGLRKTYFINFQASSQIMQISYEAL